MTQTKGGGRNFSIESVARRVEIEDLTLFFQPRLRLPVPCLNRPLKNSEHDGWNALFGGSPRIYAGESASALWKEFGFDEAL